MCAKATWMLRVSMHWFSQPIMSHRSRSAGSIRADAVRPCKVQRSGRERAAFSNQWLSIASNGAIAHNIIHRKKKIHISIPLCCKLWFSSRVRQSWSAPFAVDIRLLKTGTSKKVFFFNEPFLSTCDSPSGWTCPWFLQRRAMFWSNGEIVEAWNRKTNCF